MMGMRTTRTLLTPLIVTVAVLGAAGCGNNEKNETGSATSAPTTSAPIAVTLPPTTAVAPTSDGKGINPTTTTTAAAARLGPDSKLRVDGVGPVRVGMTLDEARRAAGIPLKQTDGPFCKSLSPEGAGFSFALIAEGGDRINLVSVFEGPIKTVSGIGVGDTETQVRAAYPSQLEVRAGAPGPHWVIYRPKDSSLASFSLNFQIDDGGRVTQMRAGLKANTEQDENCG